MNLDYPHVDSFETQETVQYSFKVKESDYVAGDIVLWDGEKKVVADPNGFSLPTSGYTPIGVVVIPASHMDDGYARMMSTRWMSCDNPENGSLEYQRMLWGTITDLTGLTNYTQVPAIARYDDDTVSGKVELTVPQEIYTAFTYAHLPSNNPDRSWEGEINTEDNGTRWKQSKKYTYVSNYYAPSPYASDGTPNPLYRAIEYSGGSINNAFSYFDGRHQTDVILEARGEKDYGTWEPASGTPEDFPPASCCDMYHTVGTSQGDWYLPSQAELGYVVPRVNDISNSLRKVNGIQDLSIRFSWSSTEDTNVLARDVNFADGFAYVYNKSFRFEAVVAFAKV